MNYEVIPIEEAQHAMENFGSKDWKCDPYFSSYHESEVKWLSKYKATKLKQFFLREPVCWLYFKKYGPLTTALAVNVEEILQGTSCMSVG